MTKKALCVINTKGGTGKTLVSLNLGKRLSKFGKTALLDVDLDNSSFSQFTGIDGVIEIGKDQTFKPFIWEGMEVFSMSLVTARDQSVSMNGDRYVQIIDDVITRSQWTADYFVFDMPGGSSDIFRSVVAVLGDILVGNVIIHQPAMVDSTRKILSLHEYLEIPVLGIIENMSYFDTHNNGTYELVLKQIDKKRKEAKTKDAQNNLQDLYDELKESLSWMTENSILYPFGPSTVEEIAAEYDIPVLGKIPLDPEVAHRFSKGDPFLDDSIVGPIDNAIEIFLKTEPTKPGFLSQLKEKVSDTLKGEIVKIMAALLMTANKNFDLKSTREVTGFTENRPFLMIITDKKGDELERIGLQVTEKAILVIRNPKGGAEDYERWVKQFEFQIVADYQTLARILLGEMKKGGNTIPFNVWSAWLNGDLKAYGTGYAPRAVNAIRNIFENENVIKHFRDQYGKVLSRWI